MRKEKLQVALLQTSLTWEQPGQNIDHFTSLIEQTEGTDLIILPEMFTTGFSMNAEALAEPMSGDSVAWMQATAARKQTAICGSLIIIEQGQCFNRFILARPTGELVTYDKRHLFRMSEENDHYSPGTDRLTFDLGDCRVFPQVCYDLRFPVFSRNDLGFHLMIYVANWPAARRAHWRTLLAARAIENQCYVVGVNRIGTDGNDVAYSGDSLAVSFDGTILLDLQDHRQSGHVSLDLAALDDYRARFPAWKDADPFNLTQRGSGST